MEHKTEGCVHVHIKDGKITNVFSHLSGFPKDCVIHLKTDNVATIAEFKNEHPRDSEELDAPDNGRIFDLGDSSYEL